MNGIDATSAIRCLFGSKAAVSIFAMTASTVDSDRAKLRVAGMNDYITKPFSVVQLAELLDAWRRRLAESQSAIG
jgi:CheY-like chemotaxis protein